MSDTSALKVQHTIDRHIEDVWSAFISKEQVEKWYGPPHASVHITAFDFTIGGEVMISMALKGSHTMWEKWTYSDIKPFEQLSFHTMITDQHGQKPLDMGNMPSELFNVFSFQVNGPSVDIVLTSSVLNPTPAFLSSFAENKHHMENAWLSALQKID